MRRCDARAASAVGSTLRDDPDAFALNRRSKDVDSGDENPGDENPGDGNPGASAAARLSGGDDDEKSTEAPRRDLADAEATSGEPGGGSVGVGIFGECSRCARRRSFSARSATSAARASSSRARSVATSARSVSASVEEAAKASPRAGVVPSPKAAQSDPDAVAGANDAPPSPSNVAHPDTRDGGGNDDVVRRVVAAPVAAPPPPPPPSPSPSPSPSPLPPPPPPRAGTRRHRRP